MKKIYSKFLVLFIGAFMFSFGANAQTVYQHYVDGKIYVKVKPNAIMHKSISIDGNNTYDRYHLSLNDAPFLGELAETINFTQIERPFEVLKDEGLDRVYRITFDDPTQVDFILDELNRTPSVEYAEMVPLDKTTLTPSDPDFNPGDQWSLFQIGAENAWNLSTGSSNVVVAIVDDAVEISHVDLAGAIWINSGETNGNGIDDDGNGYVDDVSGYDVADDDTDPGPDAPVSSYDHGTHVAGIAGASTDNGAGMASIGYGVSLMAVKSTNSATSVTHGYDGVVYAISSGADVINMSWGGLGQSSTNQSIMNAAYNNGIVCIAAAGNDNVSTTFYPAGYNNVMSVASTTTGDVKSGFSNYGSWIDISAPGSGIWSTVPNNGYQFKQGTSMASPLVAGLAGLMLSLNPGMLVDDVVDCIQNTAVNIDGINSSYAGELGAGRIDAFAAMNCVASTLNNPPVADFSANITNIVEGQSVDFTDLSYYNPDTWSWTFTGGTPSTFTGPNPPVITYNTAGTYPVELTVSNTNGSDTETKTGYIIVNGLNGCDTVDNILAGDLNYTYSYNGGSGYLNGTNGIFVDQWAEKYTGYGPSNVTGATFFFTRADWAGSGSSEVLIKVWDANGTGGAPLTELYSQAVPMSVIDDNVNGPGAGSFFPTIVEFDVPVPVNADFYIGFDLTNMPTTDTIACAVPEEFNSAGQLTRPNSLWMNQFGWEAYDDYDPSSEFASHIYAYITDAPPQANITSNSPVCEGEYLNLDATGSTNAVTWDWAINGTTTPYPTGSTPSVIMSAPPGNYWAYMQIFNYCGFDKIDSIEVTIDPTPTVSVTTTADTICPGGSVDMTASGATSYNWMPGSLTGANQTVSPSTTTTYSVIGTTGACSNEANVEIYVDDNPPVAAFTMSDDTICITGYDLSLNGAVSSNASTYSWTFTGGDITTSTIANPSVVYTTPGVYNFTLTVENTCSQTDDETGSVTVVEMADCPYLGIEDGNAEIGTVSYLDQLNEIIYVQFASAINEEVNFELISATGQIVYRSSTGEIAQNAIYEIPVNGLTPAMYMLRISTDTKQSVAKYFIK